MPLSRDVLIPSLYQAESLAPYGERLIHGFTGKPMSLGGPDTPANPQESVLANRLSLLESLGLSGKDWVVPNQVHGHRVGRTGDADFVQCDGIMLTRPQHPVMLLFADCVPVMLYDPIHHAGAVLHAGWRGTAQQIAREGVLMLQNTFGSRPEEIIGVIGPCISGCCFQVSREVAEALGKGIGWELSRMEAQGVLMWDQEYPENPRVDLKALNRWQLEEAGLKTIEVLSPCTRCEEETLFSYRRGEDGRNSAFMMLL